MCLKETNMLFPFQSIIYSAIATTVTRKETASIQRNVSSSPKWIIRSFHFHVLSSTKLNEMASRALFPCLITQNSAPSRFLDGQISASELDASDKITSWMKLVPFNWKFKGQALRGWLAIPKTSIKMNSQRHNWNESSQSDGKYRPTSLKDGSYRFYLSLSRRQ